jgi:hypothetical protein
MAYSTYTRSGARINKGCLIRGEAIEYLNGTYMMPEGYVGQEVLKWASVKRGLVKKHLSGYIKFRSLAKNPLMWADFEPTRG